MIASAIAYFVAGLLFVVGIATVAVNLNNKLSAAGTIILFGVSLGLFAAAWGCAYLGGI